MQPEREDRANQTERSCPQIDDFERGCLTSDGAPGGCAVGLIESLSDRGGDVGVLAAGHMRKRVAHRGYATPAPCGFEDALDDRRQAAEDITDNQFGA